MTPLPARNDRRESAELPVHHPKKFPALDFLRGLLAIIVCAAHAWQTLVHPAELSDDSFASYVFGISARLAVLGFFCLSGYVIAFSVTQNSHASGRFSIRDYALSRLFRVLPPLVFCLVLTWLLATGLQLAGISQTSLARAARHSFKVDVPDQLGCLFTLCLKGDLTGGLNGPLWTLAYEIQLYVLVGLGAVAIQFRRFNIPAAVSGISLIVLLLMLRRHEQAGLGWLHTLSFCAFALGYLSSIVATRIPAAIQSAAFLASAVLTPVLFLRSSDGIFASFNSPGPVLWGQFAFAIAVAAALPKLALMQTAPRLASWGHFSYTLYVIHFPILLAIFFVIAAFAGEQSLVVSWCIAASAALFTIGLSRFFAQHIEQPARQRRAFNRALLSGLRMVRNPR